MQRLAPLLYGVYSIVHSCSSKSAKKSNKSTTKSKADSFVWTDDEVELGVAGLLFNRFTAPVLRSGEQGLELSA